jgi:hypothetical protein
MRVKAESSATNWVPQRGDTAGSEAQAHEHLVTKEKLDNERLVGLVSTRRAGSGIRERGRRLSDSEITAKTLESVEKLPRAAQVTLLVELSDTSFDFAELAGKTGLQREGLIAARRNQIEPLQNVVAGAVSGLGATIAGHLWIGGSALVVEGSAALSEAIAAIPGVRFVELQIPEGQPSATYQMSHVRDGTRVQALIDAGFDSNENNRADPTKPIRIGIIEHDADNENYIAKNHAGYCENSSGCTSRVKKVYRCASTCTTTSTSASNETHGQKVAGTAAGSITQGQDGNFPGSDTTDQRHRSGMAPESEIYYYSFNASGSGLRNAIQTAVSDNVDIANMSFSYGSCDANEDRGSVNAAIRDATDADLLLVGASGNGSSSWTACGVSWPGNRPEVLTAIGLDSGDDDVAYTDLSIKVGCASRFGGMGITMFGGGDQKASVIGLAAPGVGRRMLGAPTDSYAFTSCGSSFATPVVAGAASGLRDALREIGWEAANDARAMYLNMVLSGDGWDGEDVSTPGSSVRLAMGVNIHSGFGRMRMRWPTSGGLTGPWHWHWAPHTIENGETISVHVNGSGPEPTGITEFRSIAVWFPSDLESVSDVVLEVVDACNGNAGLRQDLSFDYRKRARLTSSISGKCLVSRIIGISVPPQGETVYLGHMYHGGGH